MQVSIKFEMSADREEGETEQDEKAVLDAAEDAVQEFIATIQRACEAQGVKATIVQ